MYADNVDKAKLVQKPWFIGALLVVFSVLVLPLSSADGMINGLKMHLALMFLYFVAELIQMKIQSMI